MKIQMWLSGTEDQIDRARCVMRESGIEPLEIPSEERLGVGVSAELSRERLADLAAKLSFLETGRPGKPYPLASRESHPRPSRIRSKNVTFGSGEFVVIGGPCSVESYTQFLASAKIVKAAGATVLRGGAYKPRTSPYSFQGLGVEGLQIIEAVSKETGLVTVSEVMSPELVDLIARYVDILQIGARSMQNYPLLVEAGRSMKPVLLKRSPSASIDELLFAAEYVLNQGNPDVILCERGGVPHHHSYTRNTLDLAAIPVLRQLTHLPVIVDPSHGTGVVHCVAPMAKAALAGGADGVMIEMHPCPSESLSDGHQALNPGQFTELVADLRGLADYLSGVRAQAVAR